jgi:uncharacterized membrane protein YsdA (DUF1294 family)
MIGYLIVFLLGGFIGYYAGDANFRHKFNKWVATTFTKLMDSVGSDTKKKPEDKSKEIK